MNQTAMTKTEKMIVKFNKQYEELRENLKEEVQNLIDNGEITYTEAIQIFEASRYFTVQSYIIGKGIFDAYDDYISDWGERGRTIYFSTIINWLDENAGELTEAEDAAGNEDPYKQIYDYAVKHNVVGYEYDW